MGKLFDVHAEKELMRARNKLKYPRFRVQVAQQMGYYNGKF